MISVGDSGFGQEAKFYQTDLESRGLEIATGDQSAQKRIEFKKVEDKGYGKEGYGITIKDGVITVEAATNTGAFTQLVLFFKWEKMTYRTVKSVTSQASVTVALC